MTLAMALIPQTTLPPGASAGAINATYFLSGQAHGLDIYAEDLVDGRFLDMSLMLMPSAWRRWQSGSGSEVPCRPAMDLSFLLNQVMQVGACSGVHGQGCFGSHRQKHVSITCCPPHVP